MKAITYTEYGSVDVLKLTEVEKPTPGDNDVLIQVHQPKAAVAAIVKIVAQLRQP